MWIRGSWECGLKEDTGETTFLETSYRFFPLKGWVRPSCLLIKQTEPFCGKRSGGQASGTEVPGFEVWICHFAGGMGRASATGTLLSLLATSTDLPMFISIRVVGLCLTVGSFQVPLAACHTIWHLDREFRTLQGEGFDKKCSQRHSFSQDEGPGSFLWTYLGLEPVSQHKICKSLLCFIHFPDV